MLRLLRTSWFALALLVSAALAVMGCTPYFNQPVTFRVVDAETKQPIAGVKIDTDYHTMIDFGLLMGAWGPKEGTTAADGTLTLLIDPYKDSLNIDAKTDGYQPEANMYGASIQRRLHRPPWSIWGRDFVLEMYRFPEANVDLVVPNNYHGPILLRFNPSAALPDPIGKRQFTYVVPPNGQVAIKESGLLERVWGYERVHARFSDGGEVKTVVHKSDADTPPDAILLSFMTPVWEHHTWVYWLGTKSEADTFYKALWGDGNHFNDAFFQKLLRPH